MRATCVALAIMGATDTLASQEPFTLRAVAPGVYIAVASPTTVTNSNAAVIELDDGVLVVDSHSKPSAARALIAAIRRITSKPVRYVVNTHFHWDHVQGNEAYPAAWPAGVEIIASELTREALESRGIPRVKNQILTLPTEIVRLEAAARAAPSAPKRDSLSRELADTRQYLEELRQMRLVLPTLTFERTLTVHRAPQRIHILWLGRGHTDGDVIVYLPASRVIVTGDLLHGWVPYMGDGYPYEWAKTLEAVRQLEFDYIIPGHGDLISGKQVIDLWVAYIRDVVSEVAASYAAGGTLEETQRRVAPRLRERYGERFPKGELDASLSENIGKAYRVISGQGG